MLNFLIIVISLVAGVILRRSGKLPNSTPSLLNRYVIWVALPAAILATVPSLALDVALLLPASMPWLVFMIGAGVFFLLKDLLKLEKTTLGALILTASLGNTSFVGFPMLRALIGEEALKTAILIDQAGSFLVVSTMGLITANVFSKHETRLADIAKRIATFPPFIMLITALLLRMVNVHDNITDFFRAVSYTLGPAALLAVGYQLRFDRDKLQQKMRALLAGLSYKLLIAPAIVAMVYAQFGIQDQVWLVTTLEAAMPPMITAAIIANEHGLDEELTSLMVGIGIPISIALVPLWHLLLR